MLLEYFSRKGKQKPVFLFRLGSSIRRRIMEGYTITAVQLIPPSPPSMNATFNLRLEKLSLETGMESKKKEEVRFEWKPERGSGKYRYMGLDLNRIYNERSIAVRVIDATSLITGGSTEEAEGEGEKEGTEESPSEEQETLEIPTVEEYPVGNPNALMADIAFLAGFAKTPQEGAAMLSQAAPDTEGSSSKPPPFMTFWEKVKENVLVDLYRPDDDAPFILRRKTEQELTFTDYLTAPAVYWARKRIHLMAHIRSLSSTISHLKNAGDMSGSGRKYLARLEREKRMLFARRADLRDRILWYLTRVLAYLIAVLRPSYFAYEKLKFSRKSRSKTMNKIVKDMIKGFTAIQDDVVSILKEWGLSREDIPEFIGVSPFKTSSHHYTCYARYRILRLLFGTDRDEYEGEERSDEKGEGEDLDEFFAKAFSYRAPVTYKCTVPDRRGSYDWEICYFHMTWYKSGLGSSDNAAAKGGEGKTSDISGHFFNSHDNAAAVIALTGALDAITEALGAGEGSEANS